jgi:threonine dehydrogenase-like Zn-dependent dehydrogenase
MADERMRALVIDGPGRASVQEVDRPVAGPGEVVIDVDRAGVCGTDEELFAGDMAYLATGDAVYPLRPGHEWTGVVASLGEGVDPAWVGRRVTGDTMLGDQTCERCRRGQQHLCANRYEVGIRRAWPGALAEQLLMPAWALFALPNDLDPAIGALVEPGGNAYRAVEAAAGSAGDSLLVIGAGAVGLLAALIARERGIDVGILGHRPASLEFPRSLGFDRLWSSDEPPTTTFDAVIDASNASSSPGRALELVEPGGHVVFIGISGEPSLIDSRKLVFGDIAAVGILSASPGLAGTVELFGSGRVDPSPLVSAVVGLEDVPRVLASDRDPAWGTRPKIQVDPRG